MYYFINKPVSVLSAYLDSTLKKITNLVKHVFSPFLSQSIKIEEPPALSVKIPEIENCKISLEKAKETLSLCEAPPPKAYNPSPCIYLPTNQGLDANLKLANEILVDTLNTVRFSANNLARSRQIIDKRAAEQGIVLKDLSKIKLESEKCLEESEEVISKQTAESFFEISKIIFKIVNDVSIANCGDMSIVALFKGMDRGIWNILLEVMYIENGDHAVVVLGRDPASDPKDYKTWGQFTVVIDTWAGIVFKASEIEKHLFGFLSTDPETGEPKLMRFSPNFHRLNIVIRNICTTKELREALIDIKSRMEDHKNRSPETYLQQTHLYDQDMQIYDQVIQQLDLFHHVEILQIKLIQANALYELCNQPGIRSLRIIATLRDQMNHFIETSQRWI